MTLSEFIKKRLAEMGKNRSWLVNFGDIDWQTLSNIDKGRGISKATQEKLANALGCTQGDIQACLAEQNPLKNVIVNKKSLAKLNAKKEAPTPDPEEPAEVFQPEPELPFSEPDPDEQPKNTEVKAELLTHSFRAGRRDCLQELKDMLVQASAETRLGEDKLDDMYAAFGWAVARLIAAEDAADREAEK